MSKVFFYRVYKKTIPYITAKSENFPEDLALSLGFSSYTKKDRPEQFCKVAPKSDEQLDALKLKLKKLGIIAKFKEADSDKAEDYGWEAFSGYEYGLMKNVEAEKISVELIQKKKRHRSLVGMSIGYFFINKPAPYDEITKRMEFAYATVANKTLEKFAKFDFVVYFYEDAWQELTKDQKKILCDHELCHCCTEGVPYTKDHDIFIAEFKVVAEDYKLKSPEYHWGDAAVAKVLSKRESDSEE